MGLLRKIKANFRLWEARRIDERNFLSYDMTEIAESNSDCSTESLKSNKEIRVPPQSWYSQKHDSFFPEDSNIRRKRCTSQSHSTPGPDLSERAKAILSKAFPDIAFEKELSCEDLMMYPDPEPSICGSASSEEGADKSDRFFQGLVIDTSLECHTPGRTDPGDEFLIHSPIDAPVTSPTFGSESRSANMSLQKRLAHIFHEELSTLYEEREEEGSLTSMEDLDSEQNVLDTVSPNERGILNRWSNVLKLTMAGQCGQQALKLEEAEI